MRPLYLLAFAAFFSVAFSADLSFNVQQQFIPSQSHEHALSFTPTKPSSAPSLLLKATPTSVYRPRSLSALHRARLRSLQHAQSEQVAWDAVEVLGPDISNKHTLAQLARMSGNAYSLPGQKSWYQVDQAWNTSFPFGWESESEGFRGHVFMSSDNSTIVLSIKGTTLQGPTSKKDKFNDNLLFSCCCAFVDFSWIFKTVCDCYTSSWKCDSSCLTKALIEDSLFYSTGVKLMDDLLNIYPSSNIWLVGHSLGGALASLLGATYGLPAVAFESPGERMAATRLHLPMPPPPPSHNITTQGLAWNTYSPVAVTHVYHNADPIPQGACTGFGSPCASAGYALENRCHLGKSIIFDTVKRLGWKVDIRKHVIRTVINDVLELDGVAWDDEVDVPQAQVEEDCVDCYKWEFGDFKDGDK